MSLKNFMVAILVCLSIWQVSSSIGETGGNEGLSAFLQPSIQAEDWMASMGWSQPTCGWGALTVTSTETTSVPGTTTSTETSTKTVTSCTVEGYTSFCTKSTGTMDISLVFDPTLLVDYTTSTVYSTITVTPTTTSVSTRTVTATLSPMQEVKTETFAVLLEPPTIITELVGTESTSYTLTEYTITSFYVETEVTYVPGGAIAVLPSTVEYITLPDWVTTWTVTETKLETVLPATLSYSGAVTLTNYQSSLWALTTTLTLLQTDNVIIGGVVTSTPASVHIVKETQSTTLTTGTTLEASPNLCTVTLTESVFITETAPEVTATLKTTVVNTIQSTYTSIVSSFKTQELVTATEEVVTKVILTTTKEFVSAPSSTSTVIQYYNEGYVFSGTATVTITPDPTSTKYVTAVVTATKTPLNIQGDINTDTTAIEETYLTNVAQAQETMTAFVRSTTIVLEPTKGTVPTVTVTKSELDIQGSAVCTSCGMALVTPTD